MTPRSGMALAIVVAAMLLAACSGGTKRATSTTTAPPGRRGSSSQTSVPAVTTVHPTVMVTPNAGLTDGQRVTVRVTGFGVGGNWRCSDPRHARTLGAQGCARSSLREPAERLAPSEPWRRLDVSPTFVACHRSFLPPVRRTTQRHALHRNTFEGSAACQEMPARSSSVVTQPYEGVTLSLAPSSRPERQRQTRISRHGITDITIYSEDNDPDRFAIYVHRDGSKVTHVLTVGLGRDGRVAGEIIGSIQAET